MSSSWKMPSGKNTSGKMEAIDAQVELLARGQYATNVTPYGLAGCSCRSENAVRNLPGPKCAAHRQSQRRRRLCHRSYKKAEESLKEAEAFQANRHWYSNKRIPVSESSRQSIQSSEDARLIAIKRQETESLATERQVSKDQIAMANGAATTAALGQAHAESAEAKANSPRDSRIPPAWRLKLYSATSAEAAEQANAGRIAAESAAATSEAARFRPQRTATSRWARPSALKATKPYCAPSCWRNSTASFKLGRAPGG